MTPVDPLDELAARYGELEELERRHLRETGVGPLLLALAAALAAGLAALPLAVVPAGEPGRYWWLLAPGAVLLAVVYRLGWLAVRRLTAPYGPVGARYREALAGRDAALARLGTEPPASLSDAEAAGLRARIEAVARDITGRARTQLDMGLREAGRAMRWAVLAAVVALLMLPPLAVALVLVFADGEPAAVLLAVPVAVGGFAVLRICALKADRKRRITRTVRRGWQDQLTALEGRLTAAGRARPGEVAGVRSQELYAAFRPGPLARFLPTPPAAALRALPPDASAPRRWYWRRLGPGGAAMILIVTGACLVVVLLPHALSGLF